MIDGRKPCDACDGNEIDLNGVRCAICHGHGVMYEVMIINLPDGDTAAVVGWLPTEEIVNMFGETLEILHLRAYPKE